MLRREYTETKTVDDKTLSLKGAIANKVREIFQEHAAGMAEFEKEYALQGEDSDFDLDNEMKLLADMKDQKCEKKKANDLKERRAQLLNHLHNRTFHTECSKRRKEKSVVLDARIMLAMKKFLHGIQTAQGDVHDDANKQAVRILSHF